MPPRLLVVLLVAAAALPAACGGGGGLSRNGQDGPDPIVTVGAMAEDAPSEPSAETGGAPGAPPAHTRGPKGKAACRAVSRADVRPILTAAGGRFATLERTGHASEELSDCRFHARGAATWVTIDRAVDAARRYWYRIEEQQEFHAADASRRPRLVRGVGQDRTFGGAGAFWTPSLNRLVAYRDGTMLVVGFSVRGTTDAERREGAMRLAKLTYRRLFGARKPRSEDRIPTAPHP